MPWCPNCKAEYQEGYTECADCGIPLVDSLEEESKYIEYVPFFQANDKRVAEKLARYFEYSELKAEVSYDEENELYLVSIPPNMEKKAKKLYQAFMFVERENLENGIIEEENSASEVTTVNEKASDSLNTEAEEDPDVEYYDEELYSKGNQPSEDEATEIPDVDFDGTLPVEDTGAYIMKEDKYKDLAGTVGIFLTFGVIGLIFVLLNMAGILTILNGWMPNMIMLALFLFFIYVAISTNSKAKKVKTEIEAENKLTAEINAWFQANFTEEFLTSIHNDNFSEELNYIKMTDTLKEMLLKEFGPQNLAYLDRLIDEYYNSHFE